MNVQAQPTQRKKTTSVRFPPSFSRAWLSTGALSPTLGTRATWTGGGAGVNHGLMVSGRLCTFHEPIQDAQPFSASSSGVGCFLRSLLGSRRAVPVDEGGADHVERSKVEEGRPTFLRAILVPRLDSMVIGGASLELKIG